MATITGSYDMSRNAFVMAGEPMIFHCHHYNCFLQKSIESSKDYIDVYSILVDSAQEVSFSQFKNFFATNDMSVDERLKAIEELHSFCGYGDLNLDVSESGGKASSPHNHYVDGWISKFGQRKADEKGVAFFTAGFIAGALDAAFGKALGTYGVDQQTCKSKGEASNDFEVTVVNKQGLDESPSEGKFQTFEMNNHADSKVDYLAIRSALTGMDIVGNENGLISAFGVMLTRMFANYYTLISFKFLHEMSDKMGEMGQEIAEGLLVEAGHVCAFNTFGGIMESAEWNGMIKPMLENREDWVHGIVGCLNALGWGQLSVEELIPGEKLKLKVSSGYENNSYTKKWGTSERAVALFKTGATAGIMNLIYHGDITTNPELNEEYYNRTFKTDGRFGGKQIECRSMGADADVFEAVRV